MVGEPGSPGTTSPMGPSSCPGRRVVLEPDSESSGEAGGWGFLGIRPRRGTLGLALSCRRLPAQPHAVPGPLQAPRGAEKEGHVPLGAYGNHGGYGQGNDTAWRTRRVRG